MQTRIKRWIVTPVVGSVLAGGALVAGASAASAAVPNIHEGSTGNGVWCAQIAINVKLHPNGLGEISEDKDFGPATLAAVKQYQRANGFPADGIIGPQTGTAMLETIGWYDDISLANWCQGYMPGTYEPPT